MTMTQLEEEFGALYEKYCSLFGKMKENLTERNNGKDVYVFKYNRTGKISINSCLNISDLLDIDGDMKNAVNSEKRASDAEKFRAEQIKRNKYHP